MKMIFAMLHSEDVDETVEELNRAKYWVTKLSTTGGFLKNKNVTLVVGTEDDLVPGALNIIGVHDSLNDLLIGSEHAALTKHSVYQGSLAMIHVSDNCYISYVFSFHLHN